MLHSFVLLMTVFDLECSHLIKAGHIDSFAIVTEEAISKGNRRIVALTGREAIKVRKGSVVEECKSQSE